MSEVLGLSTSTILAWARSGLLHPQRDARGSYVFSFQDIAVLRSARELLDADVSVRRVRQTLASLRDQLPAGRPLSAVHLSALGGRVLVREEDRSWQPDTGQLEMSLDSVPPVPGSTVRAFREELPRRHRSADVWYDKAVDLETMDPEGARVAYERVLALDPAHADAHVNLGRLIHEDGEVTQAEEHYRSALAADPSSARAAYNLGVALEDRGEQEEAVRAYEHALALDDGLAVAHFNLSRLHEAGDRRPEALRHLASYKRLLDRESAVR